MHSCTIQIQLHPVPPSQTTPPAERQAGTGEEQPTAQKEDQEPRNAQRVRSGRLAGQHRPVRSVLATSMNCTYKLALAEL